MEEFRTLAAIEDPVDVVVTLRRVEVIYLEAMRSMVNLLKFRRR